jgi:hypothetical protein
MLIQQGIGNPAVTNDGVMVTIKFPIFPTAAKFFRTQEQL